MPRGCTPESILGQEAQMQDWKMSFRGRHQLLLCRPYLSLSLPTFSWEFFFSKFFTFQFSGSVFVIHSRVALSIVILSVVQGLKETRRLFWAKSWLATLLCGVQCTWVGGSASLLSQKMNKTCNCNSVLLRRVLRAARDSSRTLPCSVQALRCDAGGSKNVTALITKKYPAFYLGEKQWIYETCKIVQRNSSVEWEEMRVACDKFDSQRNNWGSFLVILNCFRKRSQRISTVDPETNFASSENN